MINKNTKYPKPMNFHSFQDFSLSPIKITGQEKREINVYNKRVLIIPVLVIFQGGEPK